MPMTWAARASSKSTATWWERTLQERDALIEALEAYGPGELIHPKYGMLNVVVVGRVSIRESHSEGGIARFAITFAEAGENTFPQAATSTQDGSTMRPTLWGRPP